MNRNQFIDILARKLSSLPEQEIKQTIDYYYEIISDKINDGMSEDQAIESLGSIDEIVAATLSDTATNNLDVPVINNEKNLKQTSSFFVIELF